MAGEVTGNTRLQKIEFYEAHLSPWNTNSAAIGLNPAMMTEITTFTTAARAAYNAAIAARNASKAATQNFYDAVTEMAEYGSSLISTIRAKAENTADPSVYTKAQIPPPAAPTPAGPPTDATNLRANVLNDGSILVEWDGTVRNGQFFSVRRQLSGSTAWTNLGSVRVKSYVDTSLPSGTSAAVYQVFAHRGSQTSAGSEPLIVYFGSEAQAA
ncbi:MAG: fibronectin type III domain-containing protein [Fimbriimonadaceae bacterium]|nr:fibronectin type III domain-containing protein [Fimbriimonadaceae bacterium]